MARPNNILEMKISFLSSHDFNKYKLSKVYKHTRKICRL